MIVRSDSVDKEIVYEGNWWLPDMPELCIRGKVAGKASGRFTLTCEMFLEKPQEKKDFFVILGKTVRGEEVTLLGCTSYSVLPKFSSWETTKGSIPYSIGTMLVGKHFESAEDVLFNKVRLGYSNLEQWCNQKAYFQPQLDYENHTTSILYQKPEKILLANYENAEISLDFTYTPPAGSYAQLDAKIEHGARILIDTPSEPMHLGAYDKKDGVSYFKIINWMHLFFSQGTAEYCYPFDLVGYFTDRSKKDISYENNCKVKIYRPQIIPSRKPDAIWPDMFFNLEHIKDSPREHVGKWLKNLQEIGFPVSIYVLLLGDTRFTDQDFMEYVQALEGYHRYRYPQKSKRSPEMKKKIKEITDSCPPVHREWLNNKLSHSHEPSLKERLKDLFSIYGDFLTSLTGDDLDYDQIIKAIPKIRNHYAHCKKGAPPECENNFLYKTNQLMSILLGLLLMEDAGFSREKVVEISKKNTRIVQLMKLVSD